MDPMQRTEPPAPGAAQSLRTFLRAWTRDPLGVAAVVPSGRQLSRLMLQPLADLPGADRQTQRVIELGAGTGAFTRALVDYGLRADNLLVVERDPDLHALLRQRFPRLSVLRADACALRSAAQSCGFLHAGLADAIVSGLGLLSMPRAVQREILTEAFAVLRPGGLFVQFTYGPVGPVPRVLREELGLRARRVGLAWRNTPPASVFVYRRALAPAQKI